ncbi:MAG: hypothetical protein ACI978_002376 [Oleispira sp.]|jgi:hypothetical protein
MESKTFGDVRVEWQHIDNNDGYSAEIWCVAQDRRLGTNEVNNQILTAYFSYIAVPGRSQAITGHYQYLPGTDALSITLKCAPDIDVTDEILDSCVTPGPGPEPCPDPCPVPSPFPKPSELMNGFDNTVDSKIYPIATGSNEGEILFPYVYMQPWPNITDVQKAIRFIQYNEQQANALLPDNLYQSLCDIKISSDSRCEILSACVNYIESDKYQDSTSSLVAVFAKLPTLYNNLTELCELTTTSFYATVESTLGLSPEQLSQLVNSEKYLTFICQTWQNYFALVITSGYDIEQLTQSSEALIVGQLCTRVCASSALCSNDLQQALNACILLPSSLYPLPTNTVEYLSPAEFSTAAVVPYALGDLQMVRHTLTGYQLGEIAHIENVMAGENKQTTYRKFDLTQDKQTDTLSEANYQEALKNSVNTDFLTEINNTITSESITTNFNNLSTTYGVSSPPESKVTGGWNVAGDSSNPGSKDENAIKLAKQITTKAANNITHTVSKVRQQMQLSSTEHVEIHNIDNSQSATAKNGVYQWVNKEYEAYTTNYGKRLMINISVTHPAKNYLCDVLRLDNTDRIKPPTLESLGIFGYKNISRENYGKLLTQYRVKNASEYTPPEHVQLVTTSFQAGEGPSSQQLNIAPGYYASTATITAVYSTNIEQLFGLVGENSFTITAVANSPGDNDSATFGPQTYSLSEETNTVCVSVSVLAEHSAAHDTAITLQEEARNYSVNILIHTELSDSRFEAWQIKVYEAVVLAADQCRSNYRQALDELFTNLLDIEPLEKRNIERDALKYAAVEQLDILRHQLVGMPCATDCSSPPNAVDPDVPASVSASRYNQFYDQMFEWGEMTYSFHSASKDCDYDPAFDALIGPQQNSLFTRFLQAGSGQISIPVKAEYAYPVLYFIATGDIWPADARFAPCLQNDLRIYNNLITVVGVEEGCATTSKPWKIVVPTSMLMVQSNNELPLLDSPRQGMTITPDYNE